MAWGNYRYMLQALMHSIKDVGVKHDLLTFSDEPLSGVASYSMDSNIELDGPQYWKFHYLSKLQDLDYDLFVFIDSDHFFVRKPPRDFSEIVDSDPWHSFLESPINAPSTKRPDWWQVPNQEMVQLWRNFGVNQDIVYNSNGGFWICKKDFIKEACNAAFMFNDYQLSKGLHLPEEVAIAVLSHMFSRDYTKRMHKNYLDVWATEWIDSLQGKIPDGSDWEFEEYMTNERSKLNPAIVHAMRCKEALTERGREIFKARQDRAEFLTWGQ